MNHQEKVCKLVELYDFAGIIRKTLTIQAEALGMQAKFKDPEFDTECLAIGMTIFDQQFNNEELDYLSETDIEALNFAIENFGSLGSFDLVNLHSLMLQDFPTHCHQNILAWFRFDQI